MALVAIEPAFGILAAAGVCGVAGAARRVSRHPHAASSDAAEAAHRDDELDANLRYSVAELGGAAGSIPIPDGRAASGQFAESGHPLLEDQLS